MRKIYPFLPLPFNKFAIFALYGLLSVALITLAQDKFPKVPGTTDSGKSEDCLINPSEVPQGQNQITVGYVQTFTNPPNPPMDPNKIPWDKYDYINILAHPKDDGEIYPMDIELGLVVGLAKVIKDKNKNAKTLLSLRNYVDRLPVGDSMKDFNDYLGKITNNAKTTIEKNDQLDGIDIEYPGMRGSVCSSFGWGENGKSPQKDQAFLNFLKALKVAIKGKILMLTVGTNIIENFKDEDIDFLNIQTYHYSLYQNLRTPSDENLISSYPNSPINEYNTAYEGWEKLIKDKNKIIMGVDFGNTIQVVDVSENEDISKSQIVEYPKNFQIDLNSLNMTNELLLTITQIKDYCRPGFPNSNNLYSFPWNSFTKYFKPSCANTTLSFNAENPWKRNFDSEVSKTPWLYYQAVDPIFGLNPTLFFYVSYEDVVSLRDKIESKPIGGMSISDVSYDDEELSLLDYIRGKISPPSNNSNTDTSDNPNNTENKTQNSNEPKKTEESKVPPTEPPKSKKAAVIAGSIIGVLAFVLLIGAFGYRLRKNRLKSDAGDFTSKSSILAHKNELPPEPSPNRFVSTSVIPVASGHVTAMFDFAGREETDLSFKKGDIIEVLEKGDGPNDWWVGRVNGVVGEFPGNYVKET